jgi:hypothetical protein
VTFSIEALLQYMMRIRPEPLEPAAAADLYGWRLGELRRCLIALERSGIIFFEGDRWKIHARFPDEDAAVRAARNAGFDVDRQYG